MSILEKTVCDDPAKRSCITLLEPQMGYLNRTLLFRAMMEPDAPGHAFWLIFGTPRRTAYIVWRCGIFGEKVRLTKPLWGTIVG